MLTFPLEQFVSFAAAVCLGVFVQAATGFAGGLVVIPLMLWAGHGIPEAQAGMLAATIPQNVLGIVQFRHTLDRESLVVPAILRLAAMPFGIATLLVVDDFPLTRARQLVGGIVIVCVLLVVLTHPKPRKQVALRWTLLAFLSSGFFAGLTATGGPMMVLWVQAHDWNTEKIRSFLFTMYLVSIPPILGMLYLGFGDRVVRATSSGLLLSPLLLVIAHYGLQCGTLLGRDRLRFVTMAILLVIGLIGLVSPMFG